MSLMNTPQRWGALSQLFHWLMFLLILGAWIAVEMHEDYPKGSLEREQLMLNHKSLGITIFALVWFRIGARLAQATPAGIGSALEQRAAKAMYAALYLLMIVMPITGMLATQLFGKPVVWFGVFELPTLVTENKDLAEQVIEAHEAGWSILLTLVGLHTAAALYHHFVRKDGVLKRMLPWGR